MPTMLEYLAQKALDAHRAELDQEKHSRENLDAAHQLVKDSPLTDWFGPVTWALLDHNLHMPHRAQDHVVVEDRDQEEALVAVRFLIARDGGVVGPQYGVACVHPDADARDWTWRARTVLNAVDVGRWIEEQRIEQQSILRRPDRQT